MKKQKGFAKKSLGQNFLRSTEVRDDIIRLAEQLPRKAQKLKSLNAEKEIGNDLDMEGDVLVFPENVLEIGPGLGFMTNKLVRKAKRFVAVEMDERAVELLHRDFDHRDNFELIHGDILQQDIDRIFEQENYSIIANIPYNITSPIFRKFLAETENRPEQMILMVQKEVAEKVCGGQPSPLTPLPGEGNKKKVKRSILSISVEVFATAEYGFTVDRSCFSPVPGVDSAVIRLVRREVPLVNREMEQDFFTVVNAGFSEKRKKLKNSLEKFFGFPASEILGEIDGNIRAEDLEVEDWVGLAERFRVHEQERR